MICRIRLFLLTVKFRWLAWRISRRVGFNVGAALREADAAGQRAFDRALLIDPTDTAAAERARNEAFMRSRPNRAKDAK